MEEYVLIFEIPADFKVRLEAPSGTSKQDLIKMVTTEMLYEGEIDYNTDVVRDEWEMVAADPSLVNAYDEEFETVT